jgi:hypothetical protein
MPSAILTYLYSASNSGYLTGLGPQLVHHPNHLLSPLKLLVLVVQILHRTLPAGRNLHRVKENASRAT